MRGLKWASLMRAERGLYGQTNEWAVDNLMKGTGRKGEAGETGGNSYLWD